MQTNYPALAKALAVEIANDATPFAAKQMASVYLKNTLNARSRNIQHECHERWKAVDAAARADVKNSLLSAMASADANVPKSAAIALSEIACVELPYGEFPDFVKHMTDAVSSHEASEHIKIACLGCLGMTCERIDEVQELLPDVPELPNETVNAILTCIVQGVGADRSDAQRFTALEALRKSLRFVESNMENKQERDFILKSFFDASSSPDPRVRELAFQCLDHVAEFYYEKLGDYMPGIFELTMDRIRNDPEEDVKVAAIEFWISVASMEDVLLDEEQRLREEGRPLNRQPCPKYIEGVMGHLVPLLLSTLSQHSDDMDEDTFDLRTEGALCLEFFSVTAKNKIVEYVLPFVQQHIHSQDWHFRDAATVAFFSIQTGPSTSALSQYIVPSLPVLLQGFNDTHKIPRDSAIHCVAQICKLHMEGVDPNQVHPIISGFMEKLSDAPLLAGHACSGIFNVCSSFKNTDHMEDSNMLSQPMLPLMKALLATMDRPDGDEGNLRVAALGAAAELAGAAARDSLVILKDLLPEILQRVETLLHKEVLSSEDKKNKEEMLGLLCGMITALYQRLEQQDLIPVTDRAMNVVIQVLNLHNSGCQEEALDSIGAVATALEDNFQKYLQHVCPMLVEGLKRVEEHRLVMVCAGVVADVCGAVGAQIQPHCDAIMGAMMACLRDGSAHRDTKPAVFSCFGDVAMAIGGSYKPYLEMSTMMLMQAAQSPVHPDDEELVEFINKLRLSVLEAYTGIIMGLADGNALQLFVPNVQSVLQFLQYLASPESARDDLCLQKAVALLGDIGQQLGPAIKPQINLPFVAQLVREASTSSCEQTREMGIWTQGVLTQLAASA